MAEHASEDERRGAAIRATWAAIARHGAAGVTIERVAGIAGFSKGVIHYYYASKRELLLAAFDAYLKSYDAEIERRLARLGREPGASDALEAIIAAALPPFSPSHVEAAELPILGPGEELSPPYKARLFVQFFALALTDPGFAEVVGRNYARQGELIADCFGPLMPGSRPAERKAKALTLMAAIDGFSLYRGLGYRMKGAALDEGDLALHLAGLAQGGARREAKGSGRASSAKKASKGSREGK